MTWVIVLVIGATGKAQIAEADKKAQQLDEELKRDASLAAALKQYNGLSTVAQHVGQVLNERFLFLPAWNTVKESAPKDIQFQSVAISEDQTFRITGISRSITSVSTFAKALSAKENVSDVTPLSVDKQSDSDLYNFSISFRINIQRGAANES